MENLLPVLDMTLSDEIRASCDELVPPGCFVADFHNSSLWCHAKVLE